MKDTLIIKKINFDNTDIKPSDEYVFTAPESNGSGASCNCYVMTDNENRHYLVKEFKRKIKLSLFRENNTVFEKAKKTHNFITSVSEQYRQNKDHYLLMDAFIGESDDAEEDSKRYYQIFPYVYGKDLSAMSFSERSLGDKLKIYRCVLHFLKMLHKCDILHLDVKLANLFYAKVSGNEVCQALDFDSALTVTDFFNNLYNSGLNGKNIHCSSEPYYSKEDFGTLSNGSLYSQESEFSKYCKTLDLTASARVFAYLLCENENTPPNDEQLSSYLANQSEGTGLALKAFFEKAFNADLKERYLSAEEMIEDVDALLDAYEVTSNTVKGFKIKELDNGKYIEIWRRAYRNKFALKDDKRVFVKDLLEQIDTGIIPNIELNNGEKFAFNEENGSALEQLILSTNKNIWLLGEAGSGKSTALRQYYLSNFQKRFSDTIVVYKRLSECVFGDDFSTIELDKIVDIAKIDNLHSTVIILFDAYDEIRRRRSLSSQDKQKDFDSAFIKVIEKVPSNFRFVITSRYLPEVIKNSDKYMSATNQRLNDEKIYRYLQLDNDGISKLIENQSLLELLQNTFCLTIFDSLLKNCKINVFDISNEAQLVEAYLKSLYEQKYGLNTSDSDIFQDMIQYIADYYFFHVKRSSVIEEKAICYASVVDFYVETKHWGGVEHKVLISHSIFQDYFTAVAIRNRLKNLLYKVYVYNGDKGESRSFFEKSKSQLKDDIKNDIISLSTRIYYSSNKVKRFEQSSGAFTPFFYQCLAYMDREHISDECEAMELLYKFLLSENFSSMYGFDISIFMRKELFHILSAYQSLELGTPVYDLKYKYYFKRDLIGYSKTGKKIGFFASWTSSIIYTFCWLVFANRDLPHNLRFIGIFSLLLLLPLIFFSLPVIYRKFIKTRRFSKVEHKYVTPSYFKTEYTRYINNNNINDCLCSGKNIKRIVYGKGVKQIKNIPYYSMNHLKSIWLPNTLKLIKRVNLSTDDNQIHYDGNLEQWKNIKFEDCDPVSWVLCQDGVLVPSEGTTLLYYDPKYLNCLELSEEDIISTLKKLIKDMNNLNRMELIEFLVDLWLDSSDTNQEKTTATYLVCVYKCRNMTDMEFEQFKIEIFENIRNNTDKKAEATEIGKLDGFINPINAEFQISECESIDIPLQYDEREYEID